MTPAVVIGATGYVGGELLRLLAAHPEFELAAAVSRDEASGTIGNLFGHLAPAYGDTTFVTPNAAFAITDGSERLAVFSAAPHGASAALLESYLRRADDDGSELHIVDASADFRFATVDAFQSVYATEHGAPQRIGEFAAGLPEHLQEPQTKHIGNPGCFATAMLLGVVPLLKSGAIGGDVFATGVTGSTGSGKQPLATTHHPQRHSNFYAYKPLAHRHVPEVLEIAERATGTRPRLNFIPHSGPFARGIHMTLQAKVTDGATADSVRDYLADFYSSAPFVRVVDTPPRVKDVAGGNFAHVAVAGGDDNVAVFVVIDNLLKGAAGGAMQWMNRLFGSDERTGLDTPAPGWI